MCGLFWIGWQQELEKGHPAGFGETCPYSRFWKFSICQLVLECREREFHITCERRHPNLSMVDGDRVKSPFSCDVDHNLYGHFMAPRRGTLQCVSVV